jgi:YfiH family protein
MLILKPYIFNNYKEIICGFSSKIAAGRTSPYYFNLSFSVGDNIETVAQNRIIFFSSLGLKHNNVAYQKQVHGGKITYVEEGGLAGESDALITDKPGIGLAVSIADCVPIFIYDPVAKIVAAIHSGWRSTKEKILSKTISKLKEFGCNPENFVVYIGPSISKNIYEVGHEVAEHFEKKYLTPKGDKNLLDVSGINYNILLQSGVKKSNIQMSALCTYAMKDILHSYRRDGEKSGRSLGVIAMKGTD